MPSDAAFKDIIGILESEVRQLRDLTTKRYRHTKFLVPVTWTPEQLRHELARRPRQQKGELLRETLLLAELKLLLNVLELMHQLVSDFTVRREWSIGIKPETLKANIETEKGWVVQFQKELYDYLNAIRLEDGPPDAIVAFEEKLTTEYERRKLTLMTNLEHKLEEARVYSRRSFLGMTGKLAAGLVAASALGFAGEAYGQEGVAKTAFERKNTALTEEDITKLMKYETVEDILNEKDLIKTKIEFVKYDSDKKTTNFDELVYQKSLKAEERKPVLVFFYKNKDPSDAKILGGAHRDAIALKKSIEQYGGDVKFVGFEVNADPNQAANNYRILAKNFNIVGFPSIGLYATFDVLKGESPKTSEGTLKSIDMFMGGLEDNKYVPALANLISNYWLATNVFLKQSPKKDSKIYRFNNSSKILPVADAELSLK